MALPVWTPLVYQETFPFSLLTIGKISSKWAPQAGDNIFYILRQGSIDKFASNWVPQTGTTSALYSARSVPMCMIMGRSPPLDRGLPIPTGSIYLLGSQWVCYKICLKQLL